MNRMLLRGLLNHIRREPAVQDNHVGFGPVPVPLDIAHEILSAGIEAQIENYPAAMAHLERIWADADTELSSSRF